MKQACIFFFLLIPVTLWAQTDSSKAEFAAADLKLDTAKLKLFKVPDSTGFGTPDGKPVSKEIGAAGGTIISEDGRVELIFPAGALVVNTTISIQPVTNLLNGSGKAYQMEPSGTQFSKPVKIIFNYTDEEAETCPPDLKSFALQDGKGKWTTFEYDDWDSTSKKLSGFIHHFSALVTNQNDVLIFPFREEIPVKTGTAIGVLHKRLATSGPEIGQNELPRFASNNLGMFVNGIKDGNDLVGTIRVMTQTADAFLVLVYESPQFLPSTNPVEIKLAFQYYSKKKKKIRWGSSKCYISVYDEYKFTVIYNFPHLCNTLITDTSTFGARLFRNRIEIKDVKNSSPTLTNPPTCPQFTFITAGCLGPANVNGQSVTNYYMSSGNTPEIQIDFATVKVVYFKMVVKAGGIPTPPTDHSDVSFPTQLKFTAYRTPQTIGGSIGAVTYKIIIEPYQPPRPEN